MSELLINMASGESVALGMSDAASLTDALWAVSADGGAVVLVGKLRHALTSDSRVVAVVDAYETDAIRAALEQAGALSPALEDLRAVLGGRAPG